MKVSLTVKQTVKIEVLHIEDSWIKAFMYYTVIILHAQVQLSLDRFDHKT